MNYTRNTPLFFKEKPSCDHPIADAEFVRDMGICQGQPVCEILWKGNLWIVRYSEVKTKEVAIAELREKWTKEIESAKQAALPKTTKVAIAAKLKISTATLRKRLKFIEENLTPPEKPPGPNPPALEPPALDSSTAPRA